MGKRHTPKKKRRIKNPVARVLNAINKPATHKDKTKYNRKDKKGLGPFYLAVFSAKYFSERESVVVQE